MYRKSKNKNIFKTVGNFKDAAGYTFMEAIRWQEVTKLIKNDNNLTTQTNICALFSIELFLKSILLSNKKEVKEYGHKIYDMFLALNSDIKKIIEKNVDYDKQPISFLNNEIVFRCFKDELQFISEDFKYLRYEYESFLSGNPIFTFSNFTLNLMDCISVLAFNIITKKQG